MTTVLKATLAAFAIAGVVATTEASAMVQNMFCGPRGILIAELAKTYDERPVSYGIMPDGALLEVLVGPDGNWTILVTQPGGPACVLVYGLDWETPLPPDAGPVT